MEAQEEGVVQWDEKPMLLYVLQRVVRCTLHADTDTAPQRQTRGIASGSCFSGGRRKTNGTGWRSPDTLHCYDAMGWCSVSGVTRLSSGEFEFCLETHRLPFHGRLKLNESIELEARISLVW